MGHDVRKERETLDSNTLGTERERYIGGCDVFE